MKRKIIILSIVVLVAIVGYYVYEMYNFANGVQNDTKKRKEFFEKKVTSTDSIYFIENDTLKNNN